jgi:hypothetical protein
VRGGILKGLKPGEWHRNGNRSMGGSIKHRALSMLSRDCYEKTQLVLEATGPNEVLTPRIPQQDAKCLMLDAIRGDPHFKPRNPHDEWLARFVDSEKCAFSIAVAADHVVAVVRKPLPGAEPGLFAHYPFGFYNDFRTCSIGYNPFSPANRHGFGGLIFDG